MSVHVAIDDLAAKWAEINHAMGSIILGSSSEVSDQNMLGVSE